MISAYTTREAFDHLELYRAFLEAGAIKAE